MLDILIIGGGPAGLSAAIYAARAQLSALVAEKDHLGRGIIAASERVDNYPGLPGISGYDLADTFRKQARALGATFRTTEITDILRTDTGFSLRCKDGKTIESRCILYAAGTSYRRLGIPGAELLGVSYCAPCDGAFYPGKEVAVIGGGDSALEDALYMANIASRVYLVHRRGAFRANQTLQARVRETPNIELVLKAEAVRIPGENRVEGLVIRQNGSECLLPVSGIFTAIGSIPNTALLNGIADLDAQGYVIAGEDGITSAPGIFAAGDVRTKSFRQVITAAADGANAVQSAERYLRGI